MDKIFGKINVFMVTVSIFALLAGYCVYVYIMYNRPVDPKPGTAANIEMNLPALEWEKYSALSRKINITSVSKVKRKVADNVGFSLEMELNQ